MILDFYLIKQGRQVCKTLLLSKVEINVLKMIKDMKFRPFERSGHIDYKNQVIAYLTKRSMPVTIFSRKCYFQGLMTMKFLSVLFVKVVEFSHSR